jgi:hypothetical protein
MLKTCASGLAEGSPLTYVPAVAGELMRQVGAAVSESAARKPPARSPGSVTHPMGPVSRQAEGSMDGRLPSDRASMTSPTAMSGGAGCLTRDGQPGAA